MASRQPDAFHRVFPLRGLLRGTSLRSLLWSCLAVLLQLVLLVLLFLILGLMATRGEVRLESGEAADYESMFGVTISAEGDPGAASIRDADRHRTDQGLRPVLWRSRHRFWAEPLAETVRAIPLLQSNGTALAVLMASAVLIGLVRTLVLSGARNLALRSSLEVVTRLRKTVHRQTLRLGPSDLRDRNYEQSLRLFTSELEHVGEAVFHKIYRHARQLIALVFLVAFALSVHWLLALKCLIPMAACWFLIQRERSRFDDSRRLAEDRIGDELRLLGEGLQKTRLVRGYGMENYEQSQFEKHLERFRGRILSLRRGEGLSHWMIRVLVLLCLMIVLFLVGLQVLSPPSHPHSISFEAALLLLATFAALYRPVDELTRSPELFSRATVAADSVQRYNNEIPEVGQAVGAKFLQPLARSCRFENVTYALPNGKVLLDGFDLKLPAGGITCFVSIDPLEAQALMYLLPRFIEPQSGRVLIDSEDLAWVTLESLRAETVYVGGSDPFFTGTVLENIVCGNEHFSLQDATRAAKEVHAHNFVLKLPQGYETMLGHQGATLDSGQTFRLGLARAALRNPALMIIEEPATPLDEDTKSLLDDTYHRLAAGRTLFFLPARLSTLRRADRIVLIHRGKVEATGTHATLVKTSQLYRHWEYLRFNEFRHEVAVGVS